MSTESARPAASGKLRERPFPRLIQQVFRKRVTGRLVISDDSGDITQVWVREGLPVHTERPNDIDRLDHILVSSGLVSSAAIAQANEEVNRSGRRLGEALVMRGLITREALADVLKTQIRRKLTRLFFARAGTYEVFTEAHYYGAGDEFDLMRIDPRALLYAGIRAAYDDDRLRQELAPLAGFSFKLVQVPPAFVVAMGIGPEDPTVAALRERALLLEDLELLPAKATEARAVVLALLYADLLDARAVRRAEAVPAPVPGEATAPVVAEPGTARQTWGDLPLLPDTGAAPSAAGATPTTPTAAPAAPPRPPPAAPPAARTTQTSMPAARTTQTVPVGTPARTTQTVTPVAAPKAPTPEALRATLTDLAGRLDKLSHFELLGVAESASADEIKAAYARQMRQLHPDRLAAAGLRELAPMAERVVARMGEASSVLSDPRRRADYLAIRAGKQTDSAAAAALVDAEMSFQKGEVFLKKGDYAKAIECFAEAAKASPTDTFYRAHLAWTRFEDPRARKEALARDSLAAVQDAIRERPNFARAHYWAGQLQKFLAHHDEAERCFREAIRLDRTLLEAEREVRLIDMRKAKAAQERAAVPQRTATAPKQGGGLFGKLFNRDE